MILNMYVQLKDYKYYMFPKIYSQIKQNTWKNMNSLWDCLVLGATLT